MIIKIIKKIGFKSDETFVNLAFIHAVRESTPGVYEFIGPTDVCATLCLDNSFISYIDDSGIEKELPMDKYTVNNFIFNNLGK